MGQIHRSRGGEGEAGGERLSAGLLLLLEEGVHAWRDGAELVSKREDRERSEIEWGASFLLCQSFIHLFLECFFLLLLKEQKKFHTSLIY